MGSELIKRGEILPDYIWSADSNIKNPDLQDIKVRSTSPGFKN